MNYRKIAIETKKSLNVLYKELKSIIDDYNTVNIYKKSLPLKPTNKCSAADKEKIVKILEQTYYPYFDILLPMIESGMVECEPNINNNDKILEKTIYHSWDKLFTFTYIRYNLTISGIMQIYLFLEQTLVKYLNKYYNFQDNSLLEVIAFLEKYVIFPVSLLNKLTLYKNVINVYKHGYGKSYKLILKSNPEILNDINANEKNKNYEFIFNLNKINIDEIYKISEDFLNIIIG